ncbi:unnamed protein product [Macrosiphum euphorbiae]|uniref:Transcription factor Adf-1 n=1 Tax=Macrosiphum euphorbiae TaxID=13131 RepID=A0AAV0X1N0_9HEMI|nr:unnamed protein product [Macrosiphum euphorbiae]CAI6361727.1 unnamed protein product [Macrosiphum euphorbiae]
MAESQNLSKVVFLPDQEEVLIEEVRNNPVLYDLSKTSHKDIILKDEIWKDISIKVGRSIDDCKRRWKNIKDTYNRNKRKLGTGSASSSKKKWILADRVSFLNSVNNERSSTSNIDTPLNEDGSVGTDDEIDIDDSNKDDVDLPGCSFAGNRARSKTDKLAAILAKKTQDRNMIIQSIQQQNEQLLNANKNEEDDIDLFFKSIALTVKKLPTMGINEAKIKTLMFINELQEKYANPPQISAPSFFPIQNFQQNQQHYYGVPNTQNISPISYSDSDRSQTSSSTISYTTAINPQAIAPSHLTFSPQNDLESTSSPAYFNNSK